MKEINIGIMVKGKIRYCPLSWLTKLEGPLPPWSWHASDGCTSSPDYLCGGYDLWPACWIHDWFYAGQVMGMTRSRADAILRRNIRAVLKAQGCPWWRRVAVSTIYWLAVRFAGKSHFKEWSNERGRVQRKAA